MILFLLFLLTLASCSPDSGGDINGTAICKRTEATPHLTVATYNIHAGVGRDGTRDLKRIAETLRGADVVGLQEVDNGRVRSGFANQARSLAAALGHRYWQHIPAEDYWPFGAYGIAVSSLLPVVASGAFDLPVVEGNPLRRLAWIKFLVDCRPMHAFIIHATRVDDSTTSAQAAQIQAAWRIISQKVNAVQEPVILLGDFNAGPNSQVIQWLRERMIDVTEHQPSQPSVAAPLDYIFLRGGLQVVKVTLKDNGASDHPAIVATLRMYDWGGGLRDGPPE